MWELDEFNDIESSLELELVYVEAMIVFIESGMQSVMSYLYGVDDADEVLRMIKLNESYE